ncbi:MAG TPA: methyltransferase domain-containing protein [Planctomycetaceae bacterium]|nr:methyltransferase domain-containing protein [Planctomycetaceae bacterium]
MPEQNRTLSDHLLSMLRDPASAAPLQLADDGNKLLSLDLRTSWKIIDDIPRFTSDEHLESFGHQWTHFDVAHDDEDRATFVAKTGITLSDLAGQKVLDAGCGGGRYSKVCGDAGAKVFGADHTCAVDKARKVCESLPHVYFVQADLKRLPFEPASFDFVFSIGVMHHDADTRSVFDAVAKMVKPGGRYSVWLYRQNQWWQELINRGLRTITTRLPSRLLMPFCHLGAILGGIPIVNKTFNKIVNFSAHANYENRVCDTFDWWAPKFQHHHTVEELSVWFHEAGFTNLTVLPPEKSGRFYRWTYEKNLLIGSGVNVTGVRK